MARLILPALLTLTLAHGQAISTQYTAGKSLRVEVQSTFAMETVSFSSERDGVPVEGRGGFGGMNSKETRNVVMIDTVVEVKDGAPSHVRREFDTISSKSVRTFGENENESERECPLNGVTLDLTLNDGEVVAEVVEGEAPDDEALLEGHSLALALDGFLPEGEVDAGDSWEIDGAGLLHALGFDLEKALFPQPRREEGEGGEGRGPGRRGGGGMRGGGQSAERYFVNGTWSLDATLEADTEEHEGVSCYVITLKGEGSGEVPEPERSGRGGRGGQERQFTLLTNFSPLVENSFEVELEGKLFFSVEGKHPLHLELEAKLSTESTRESQRGESMTVTSISQEGTLKYTVDLKAVVEDGEGK